MTFEPSVIQKQCTPVALSSFITHCNPYIVKMDDWSLIFDFLLCIGVGCHPSDLPSRQTSETEEGVENVPQLEPRDIEIYKKCADILAFIIKEILPGRDASINQMAIDSLVTLRFYSLKCF